MEKTLFEIKKCEDVYKLYVYGRLEMTADDYDALLAECFRICLL